MMPVRLTDDELEQLRLLLPIAAQLKEEAEYRAAQRLVLQTWRKTIVFIAGGLAAVIAFREQLLMLLGLAK